MSQGLADHLTTPSDKVEDKDKAVWSKTDNLLLSLLWQLIDPSLQPIFLNYTSCYDMWKQTTVLYTNDIQRLYIVVSNLFNLRQQGMSIPEFLGELSSIQLEFNSALSPE